MQQQQQQADDRATVRYWPRGASAELFRHHESEVVVAGPAGTGKTYGALWRLHLAALKYPGMRGIMLRKVQEDLTASALVTYQERVLGAGSFGVRPFGGSKIKPAGFQYPNGAELLIGGLDKAEKVMSREYDLIYVNEATELDHEDWELLSTRARWGVMPYQQLYGDCNPQGPTHWLYQRGIEGKTTLLNSVHEDNPMLYDHGAWTAQGRSYLATLDKLSGHTRQRLRHGLWVAAEGAVYPSFNRQTHVQAVDCTGWAAVLGLDLGATHPNALLTVRFAGERVHIAQELYRTEMTATEIIDATAEEYADAGAEFVVVDPSSKDIRLDLQRRGLHVRLGQNAITVGIKRVSALLPNLTIDPSCTNTIAEFESYRYPDRSGRDVPEDKHNHSLDSLRYIAMELGTPKRKVRVF
jgi:PBSX family phage terminase large subunit